MNLGQRHFCDCHIKEESSGPSLCVFNTAMDWTPRKDGGFVVLDITFRIYYEVGGNEEIPLIFNYCGRDDNGNAVDNGIAVRIAEIWLEI